MGNPKGAGAHCAPASPWNSPQDRLRPKGCSFPFSDDRHRGGLSGNRFHPRVPLQRVGGCRWPPSASPRAPRLTPPLHTQSSFWPVEGYARVERFFGISLRDTLKGTDNDENHADYLFSGHGKGKLHLGHGDWEDNLPPAMTLRVADVPIRADKSFDFLPLPDRGHGLNEPPGIRGRRSYVVEHLLTVRPPEHDEVWRPLGGPGGRPEVILCRRRMR